MKNYISLLLRLALGLAFLSAVADRLGFWGSPGEPAVGWGNWANFVTYTSILTFNASEGIANILALIATVLEVGLGVFLILGIKVKQAAYLSGVLLLIFALSMSLNTSIKFAFDYSVFTAAFASFLLSIHPHTKWSIDELWNTNKS